MKNKFYLIVPLLLLSNLVLGQQLKLSTNSDSCLYYYYKGWEMVMDYGDFTASEKAYRKMANFDPDFLIGQSLLGRIATDVKEREKIYEDLLSKKNRLKGDELLLFEVFMELLHLMNVRVSNPEKAPDQVKKALQIGEINLRQITHRYPDDIYYKAEYIEVLHANHGAQLALDSLRILASPFQQKTPFLLGYAAVLEAELGQFDSALQKAEQLIKDFEGKTAPKPYAVFGAIYEQMGKKEAALEQIEKALSIDPGNISVQRIYKRLKK